MSYNNYKYVKIINFLKLQFTNQKMYLYVIVRPRQFRNQYQTKLSKCIKMFVSLCIIKVSTHLAYNYITIPLLK